MKESEKLKIAKIIEKIANEAFDENDVDLLLIKLRDLSKEFSSFQEISNFVAHNKERDQGIFRDSLNANYYYVLYSLEFGFDGKLINLSMFPLYIKRLLMLQIDQVDSKEFSKLKVNKKFVKDLIHSIEENKQLDRAYIEDATKKQQNIIEMLLSTPYFKSVFNSDCFFKEFLNILNKYSFPHILGFSKQAEKIILCILFLLKDTPIMLPNSKKGYLRLYSNTKNTIEVPSFNADFGNFILLGEFTIGNKTILYPMFSTSLDISKYCDESMFQFSTNTGGSLIKYLTFNQEFYLDCKSWKLIASHTVTTTNQIQTV